MIHYLNNDITKSFKIYTTFHLQVVIATSKSSFYWDGYFVFGLRSQFVSFSAIRYLILVVVTCYEDGNTVNSLFWIEGIHKVLDFNRDLFRCSDIHNSWKTIINDCNILLKNIMLESFYNKHFLRIFEREIIVHFITIRFHYYCIYSVKE